MNATWIIAAFVVIDTIMERLDHHSDVRATIPDSEILTVASGQSHQKNRRYLW